MDETNIPVPVLVVWDDASEETGQFTRKSVAKNTTKQFSFVGFLVHYDDDHAVFVSHIDPSNSELHNRFILPWFMIRRMVELTEGGVLVDGER
jgi:hypothetical protein